MEVAVGPDQDALHDQPDSTTSQVKPRKKRPWVPPAVEEISLEPGEDVLGNCSNTTYAATRSTKCNQAGGCPWP